MLCAAACHGTVHVSVFSGQVVLAGDPKTYIWLSVTIFGCLGQRTTTITNPVIVPDTCAPSGDRPNITVAGICYKTSIRAVIWLFIAVF